MNSTNGILCVFAHPDDEQFGTAAALMSCVERGIPVQILCATRGDAGEISDPSLATRETLAAVREAELRTACEMLGFEPPILLDYLDGRLNEAPRDELADHIVAEIRRLQPRVVITFDENGGYGHPDHIAIHHATLIAFAQAGDDGYRPDLGAAHAPEKLYATAYPRSTFVLLNEGLKALGLPEFDLGAVQTIASAEIGTPDEFVTTAVPAGRYFERRMAAMFAHRTQYGANSIFARFPEELNRRLAENDVFRRISPAPPEDAVLPDEHDLWHGLPV